MLSPYSVRADFADAAQRERLISAKLQVPSGEAPIVGNPWRAAFEVWWFRRWGLSVRLQLLFSASCSWWKATSGFNFLLPWLPHYDGTAPQTVSQNQPSLTYVHLGGCFITTGEYPRQQVLFPCPFITIIYQLKNLVHRGGCNTILHYVVPNLSRDGKLPQQCWEAE